MRPFTKPMSTFSPLSLVSVAEKGWSMLRFVAMATWRAVMSIKTLQACHMSSKSCRNGSISCAQCR